MNAIRILPIFLFLLACGPQSITLDAGPQGRPCNTDPDCPGTQVCIDQRCAAPLSIIDAGRSPDALRVDVVNARDVVGNLDVEGNQPDVAQIDVLVVGADVVFNNPDVVVNNPDVVPSNPDVAVSNPDVIVVNNPDVVVNNPDVDPGPVECVGNNDCGGNEVCSFDGIITPPTLCLDQFPAGAAVGETCERTTVFNNESCQTRLCLGNYTDRCSTLCRNDTDCPTIGGDRGICTTFAYGASFQACAEGCERTSNCSVAGDVCKLFPDTIANRYEGVCLPGDPTDIPAGGDCDDGRCANNLCVRNPDNNDLTCSEPCRNDSDCPNNIDNCIFTDIQRPNGSGDDRIRICQ